MEPSEIGREDCSIRPVYSLFVAGKLQLSSDSCCASGLPHKLLLLRGERLVSSAAIIESSASVMVTQDGTEAVILSGEHLFLEVGEAIGIAYRLRAPIERAGVARFAEVRIDQLQYALLFAQGCIHYLMQTMSCFRTIRFLADRIRGRNIGDLYHSRLNL